MKCASHPENEAIALCPSCGRGICEVCRVNVLNVPHCKECAEWMLFQMVSSSKMLPWLPMPRGEPRKEYFVIGYIGAMIMSIGALSIGYFIFVHFGFHPGRMEVDLLWVLLVISAIFSVGLALTGIGFFGFYKNYGSIMGLITSVFLMISAFIFLASTVVSIEDRPTQYYIEAGYLGSLEIVGISLVLMGVTFLLVRNFTMIKHLSTVTGTYCIINASLFCSILFAIMLGIAWFALMVACILMSVVFFLAKLPPKNVAYTLQRLSSIGQPPVPIQNPFSPLLKISLVLKNYAR